jgi:hypothetical protein
MSFEAECGQVIVPDRAFIPMEISGGGMPEYAVTFGRAIGTGEGGATPGMGVTGAWKSLIAAWSASWEGRQNGPRL